MGSKRGFTLIELMLVIVIVGSLAAMVVPKLVPRLKSSQAEIARADIKGNLALALRLYAVDHNGNYPSTGEGLNGLISKPGSSSASDNWKGPYLERPAVDPWKQPYVYHYPGSHPPYEYDLYSLGPDGEKSDDDITNWE